MGQTIIRTTLTVLRLALEKLDSLLFLPLVKCFLLNNLVNIDFILEGRGTPHSHQVYEK
jgi:hypothetical protein